MRLFPTAKYCRIPQQWDWQYEELILKKNMINLLPPFQKDKLLLEKDKKLALVLGSTISIALVCLALILFALKFYLLEDINVQRTFKNITAKKYETQDFLSFKNTV